MNENKLEEAYDIFTKVIDKDPNWAEAWNKRATVLYLMGEYELSQSDINKVLQIEKRHFGALTGQGLVQIALENYEKAFKLLLKSNIEKPNKADTLNYLGFTSRKLGDFENGEKYYLQGLALEPKHKGINEYLGELYVATNRHNLAVERLEVLKGCNCEEYDQLKAVIAGEKSKY